MVRTFIACVSWVVFAIATQSGAAEKKKEASPPATGAIKLVRLGIDGEPIEKNADILWRKVAPNETKKTLWHDFRTDTWWEQVAGFATSGESTFSALEPGTYRVTVRDGHDATGAIGIGEPVVIDEQHLSVSTEVRLAPGATLRLTCVDAKSGRPIPPPFLDLRLVECEVPLYWQFRAEPIAGQPGEFQFRHLLPGHYRLKAMRDARNSIDKKYELSDGEITLEIDGTQTMTRKLKFTSSDLTKEEIERRWPFEVYGRVTDKDGQPIKDAVVSAHSGIATMLPTGAATSDAEGHYRLYFAEGGLTSSSGIGPAIISVSKPGMSEANLGRQGEFALAYKQPNRDELADWLAKRPLLLAHRPVELNFTLAHAGTLSVRIHRENKDDRSGMRASLKGATMPPGCSVIESGRTDRWGEVSFAKVPLDQPWWVEVETHGFESIRTQPFKLTDPQRYELALDWRTDEIGVEVLDIHSLSDALGRDRTLELVGDDPLSHPPATAADQDQARDWLRRIAEVNQLWLAPPPAEVSRYHYDFQLADNPSRRYEVPKDRRVAGVVFHGIAYVSALSCLTTDPQNVVVRKLERSNGRVSISYTLRKPASISAGNGILDTYRGFFSMPLREGILVFDSRTFQVESHETDGVVETYSDYVRAGDDRFVPKVVEVNNRGAGRYRWSFELYEPGLWLLDHSLATGRDEKDGFVRIENLEINGAAPQRLHVE